MGESEVATKAVRLVPLWGGGVLNHHCGLYPKHEEETHFAGALMIESTGNQGVTVRKIGGKGTGAPLRQTGVCGKT